MSTIRKQWLLLLIICLVSACATRQEVAYDYSLYLKKNPQATSHRTVIFFLIDGLPLQTMKDEVFSGKLPNIYNYFVADKNKFFIARTIFPSLTFPAVTSLLTERTVDQHDVYGNLILDDGKEINFEAPASYPKLNAMIGDRSVFTRIGNKGLKSASLDFAFNAGATVHISDKDIESGVAVLNKNYSYVDAKLIDSLKLLLTETDSQHWPDFIFVHLVGVDLTSHDHGPESTETKKYLEKIDGQLSEVFAVLNNIEKAGERKIIAMMSTDHGFDNKVSKVLDLRNTIYKVDPRIKILNEGRYASLFFPDDWSFVKRSSLLQTYIDDTNMDIVALRQNNEIQIQSHNLQTTIHYADDSHCSESTFKIVIGEQLPTCPENLDVLTNNLYYPYFITNVSHYFQTSGHPDAILIPKPGIAFYSKEVGQHGGPTPQEVFVPLLMHNATLANMQKVPSLSELLKFM